jgi:hypothetical protein
METKVSEKRAVSIFRAEVVSQDSEGPNIQAGRTVSLKKRAIWDEGHTCYFLTSVRFLNISNY